MRNRIKNSLILFYYITKFIGTGYRTFEIASFHFSFLISWFSLVIYFFICLKQSLPGRFQVSLYLKTGSVFVAASVI